MRATAADRAGARPPAVLLGGRYTALSVARSLGSMGVEVHALADEAAPSPVGSSRYVSTFAGLGPDDDVQARWAAKLAGTPSGAVILPCGDHGLEFVARNRSRLAGLGYRPLEADDDVVLAMLDKEQAYGLARAAGIDVPRTVRIRSVDELPSMLAGFEYPCALKPVHSHLFSRSFPGKAVVVHCLAEMEEALHEILPTGLEMIVTEIVPGDDEYCSYYSYMDDHGQPLLHFTKRKLRQYPIGFGTGSYHVTGWDPEPAEIGLRFFRHVGLVGLGNVEFKRDARDGRLKLIECNPRFTAANEIVRIAGIDLARIAYLRALGEDSEAGDAFADGVRQWHPVEDLRAFLSYRAAGELSLGAWLASLAHRQHLPIFSWRDPKPTVANGWTFAGRLGRAAWRARRRTGSAAVPQKAVLVATPRRPQE